MSEFSEAERVRIMAEARANIERPVESYVPPAHDGLNNLDRWREQQAEQQREERLAMHRPRRLTDAEATRLEAKLTAMINAEVAMLDAKFTAMIDKQYSDVLEVIKNVGEAFVKMEQAADDALNKMQATVDGMFAKMQTTIANLRTQHGKTGNGSNEPIDLPNPLPDRRLQ